MIQFSLVYSSGRTEEPRAVIACSTVESIPHPLHENIPYRVFHGNEKVNLRIASTVLVQQDGVMKMLIHGELDHDEHDTSDSAQQEMIRRVLEAEGWEFS